MIYHTFTNKLYFLRVLYVIYTIQPMFFHIQNVSRMKYIILLYRLYYKATTYTAIQLPNHYIIILYSLDERGFTFLMNNIFIAPVFWGV